MVDKRGAHLLKCLFVAATLLFAQQAAQLHALAHANSELALAHKTKAPSHPIEQCIAFHAVDSALTAASAFVPCINPHSESPPRDYADAQLAILYRLPARAPPPAA